MIYGIKMHGYPSAGQWQWGQGVAGDYCTIDLNAAYVRRAQWALMSPHINYVVEEYTSLQAVAGVTGPEPIRLATMGGTGCMGPIGATGPTGAIGFTGGFDPC